MGGTRIVRPGRTWFYGGFGVTLMISLKITKDVRSMVQAQGVAWCDSLVACRPRPASSAQPPRDIDLAAYLAGAVGPVKLVMDLRITHERLGSSSNPLLMPISTTHFHLT